MNSKSNIRYKKNEVVVFLGPTMPKIEAEGVLPAIYLPPVKQSDILSVVRTMEPKVIAVIDGEFGQSLAVWHKEIVFALQKGVEVWGAASMGALRAAELAEFGMKGVGDIYQLYRTNQLVDDDEVALMYAGPDLSYRSVSIPLVNIRATLANAVSEEILEGALATRVILLAKNLFFGYRNINTICADLSDSERSLVKYVFRDHYVDVKKRDATQLLNALSTTYFTGSKDIRSDASKNCPLTQCFRTQIEQDRWSEIEGRKITQRDLCKHAALHLEGFESIRDRALDKSIIYTLASELGITSSSEELDMAVEAFYNSKGIVTKEDIHCWLKSQDLESNELRETLEKTQIVQKLRAWYISKQGAREITRPLMEEIKISGLYDLLAKDAANKNAVLAGHMSLPSYQDYQALSTLDLIADHHRATEWSLPLNIGEWIHLSGFNDTEELRQELFLNFLFRKKLDCLRAKVLASWKREG